MNGWDIVVPATSVLVTGGVAVWSKIIDARSKREDREHARTLDYEGRVWQAKKDLLRTLITACRALKSKALRELQADNDEEDKRHWRARTVEGLDQFHEDIGGNDGLSELTAYASDELRVTLNEMLQWCNQRLAGQYEWLLSIEFCDTQLEKIRALRSELDKADGPVDLAEQVKLSQQESEQWMNRSRAYKELGAVEIDADELAALCDKVIDAARQDFKGRY
ncbi:hypothetical protein [Mycobacteroides abscessus]|uniref:hypothetical protein n=1 Tax=Mycobacteroides abscessus TaxID=36809 RepID=UPI0009A8FE96|nr:hypothetical protein [Mycobacteroides abscessus]QOF29124.1 hypothetical protein E3G43_002682 [Mycobacteroides abscessus]